MAVVGDMGVDGVVGGVPGFPGDAFFFLFILPYDTGFVRLSIKPLLSWISWAGASNTIKYQVKGRKEVNVLFSDAFNTFYL